MEKIIFHSKNVSSVITLQGSGTLQLGTAEWSLVRGGRFYPKRAVPSAGAPQRGEGMWGDPVAKIQCHCSGLSA